MDWTPIAIISGLATNALVVAYGYGKVAQRIKNLENGATTSVQTAKDDRKELKQEINSKSHEVLPECQQTFNTLIAGMGEIKGQVNTLISLVLKEKV